MASGETISYLITILLIVVLVGEMVVFYFYYRLKANKMNKRLPPVVSYIIISALLCSLYGVSVFVLNYKMCYGIEVDLKE